MNTNTATANTTHTPSLGDTIQNMLNGMPGNQLPVLILTSVPMGKQSFSVANMVPAKRRGRPVGSIARVKAVLGKTGRGPGRPPKNSVMVTAKRGPGRPKKNAVVATETKRNVGRPRKNDAAKPAKRGPGRPKKVATEAVVA